MTENLKGEIWGNIQYSTQDLCRHYGPLPSGMCLLVPTVCCSQTNCLSCQHISYLFRYFLCLSIITLHIIHTNQLLGGLQSRTIIIHITADKLLSPSFSGIVHARQWFSSTKRVEFHYYNQREKCKKSISINRESDIRDWHRRDCQV